MRLLPVVLSVALLLSASGAGAKTIKKIEAPNSWYANAYSSDDTGEFSHCAASAPYRNGTTLFVSINNTFDWQIAFLNDAWRLTPNASSVVFIKIDNAPWKSYSALALASDFLVINVPTGEQEMIDLFRFGRTMQIKFDTWEYFFELSGTSKLLVILARCVDDQLRPKNVAEKPRKEPDSSATAKREDRVRPNEVKDREGDKPGSSTGTGIIVSEAGAILTNNHVVENCDSISFSKEGELTQKASLLRADKTNDLALLKSSQEFGSESVATFRLSPPVRAGEQVAVYGFPLAGVLSVTGNVVSGNISSLAGLGDDVRYYQTSAPVQPGNSGGPLLDYAGNVIGIVTSRIDDFAVAGATGAIPQNVNFAIKAPIATSFMETHGVNYRASSEQQTGDLSGVASAAKKFTVLVECKR